MTVRRCVEMGVAAHGFGQPRRRRGSRHRTDCCWREGEDDTMQTRPIYVDEGTEYPELAQPPGEYVSAAEEEFVGQEVTWPVVNRRAWELKQTLEGDEEGASG